MYSVFIFSAQGWVNYVEWFSIFGVLIMIFITTSKKASKKELNQVKTDMDAQIKNLESNNRHEHDMIRNESLNLFRSIESHVKTIVAILQNKDYGE